MEHGLYELKAVCLGHYFEEDHRVALHDGLELVDLTEAQSFTVSD